MDTKEKRRSSAATPHKRPPTGRTAPKKPTAKKPAPVKKKVPVKAAAKPRPQRPPDKQPTPDVVYTEPGLFNRNRMILRIATVAAVVLALIFGISIFFKVEKVTVAGNNKYTSGEVLEASGIRVGDNLFGLNNAKISSNIIAQLPYVGSVRVGIKLPNTVKIEIVELQVVYSVEADDGSWWFLRSDGVIIEKTNNADAGLHTKLVGVKITKPVVGEKAVAAQTSAPEETLPDGQTAPNTVKPEEQLDAAIALMQYLEECGMIGEAASINVSNLTALQIWYGTRFQVDLGDTTDLKTKVSNMQKAINSMSDTETGILNVATTNSKGEYTCIPFPS